MADRTTVPPTNSLTATLRLLPAKFACRHRSPRLEPGLPHKLGPLGPVSPSTSPVELKYDYVGSLMREHFFE
jgi:hypothetical protein